jgi:hypothetical protein
MWFFFIIINQWPPHFQIHGVSFFFMYLFYFHQSNVPVVFPHALQVTNQAQTSAIAVSAAPSNGKVVISPLNGTAFQTAFTVVTNGWESTLGVANLMFEFSRVASDGSFVLLAARSADQRLMTSSLPAGQASSNFTVTLNVRAIDSIGGFTDVRVVVVVRPLPVAANPTAAFTSILSSMSSSATNNQQTDQFVSNLGALSASLNSGAFGLSAATTSNSTNGTVSAQSQAQVCCLCFVCGNCVFVMHDVGYRVAPFACL